MNNLLLLQQTYKPGSVPVSNKQASVIYLGLPSPVNSSDLPLGIGRAALNAPVYMVLQLARDTNKCITTLAGRLLPHLFTLTFPSKRKAVIFCYPAPPSRVASR